MGFAEIVSQITEIGYEWHRDRIVENSIRNAPFIERTIRDIAPDARPCLVVSAGPSLHRNLVLQRFKGGCTVIAVDGAYVRCLKAGIIPDYVITLDPHPTRMVRWFGDPDLEKNSEGDDYFQRQDLDIEFRKKAEETNRRNIEIVDECSGRSILICGSTIPENVQRRTGRFNRFWFAPLVDEPTDGSLTAQMVEASKAPAMNTGGTVGTAAWVFAHAILQSANIAVIGMDLGYYADTPLEQTQSFHMLKGDPKCYKMESNPAGEWFYTDPTYAWYRQNFLDLLKNNDATVTNCSEGGLLYGENVKWEKLDKWLASCS